MHMQYSVLLMKGQAMVQNFQTNIRVKIGTSFGDQKTKLTRQDKTELN